MDSSVDSKITVRTVRTVMDSKKCTYCPAQNTDTRGLEIHMDSKDSKFLLGDKYVISIGGNRVYVIGTRMLNAYLRTYARARLFCP